MGQLSLARRLAEKIRVQLDKGPLGPGAGEYLQCVLLNLIVFQLEDIKDILSGASSRTVQE